MNHAALAVDVFRIEQQAVGPVVQDPEAGVNGIGDFLHRDAVDIIDRLVDAGIGVQVGTELHADRLAVLHHAVARKMFRTIEAHMLKEVRQTALLLIFQNGTDLLGDIEISLALRLFVMPDVIGQAVVEFSDFDIGIHRDRRHLLCRSQQTQAESQGRENSDNSFHLS